MVFCVSRKDLCICILQTDRGDLPCPTMHLTSLGHDCPKSNQELKVPSRPWEDIIFIPYRSDLNDLGYDRILYKMDTDPYTYYDHRPQASDHSRWHCIRPLPFIIEHKFPSPMSSQEVLLAIIATIRSDLALLSGIKNTPVTNAR